MASRAKPRLWTDGEDKKLTSAVANTTKKTDWAAIALLVPDRTDTQCRNRWRDVLDPSNALTAGRKGYWSEEEFIKLKKAVEDNRAQNWSEIARLVPGRTESQCKPKWFNTSDPTIGSGRAGKGNG
jgi:myb proto-oncogene protein